MNRPVNLSSDNDDSDELMDVQVTHVETPIEHGNPNSSNNNNVPCTSAGNDNAENVISNNGQVLTPEEDALFVEHHLSILRHDNAHLLTEIMDYRTLETSHNTECEHAGRTDIPKFVEKLTRSSNVENLFDKCIICLDTVKEPSYCSYCGQKYCHDCILKWVEIKNTCPHCITVMHSIVYNVKNSQDYKVRDIPEPPISIGCDRTHIHVILEGTSANEVTLHHVGLVNADENHIISHHMHHDRGNHHFISHYYHLDSVWINTDNTYAVIRTATNSQTSTVSTVSGNLSSLTSSSSSGMTGDSSYSSNLDSIIGANNSNNNNARMNNVRMYNVIRAIELALRTITDRMNEIETFVTSTNGPPQQTDDDRNSNRSHGIAVIINADVISNIANSLNNDSAASGMNVTSDDESPTMIRSGIQISGSVRSPDFFNRISDFINTTITTTSVTTDVFSDDE